MERIACLVLLASLVAGSGLPTELREAHPCEAEKPR